MRGGKLTVPQVASKQSHYGEEESSKKLSEVYMSLYLPWNRAKIYELARVGECIIINMNAIGGTPSVVYYMFLGRQISCGADQMVDIATQTILHI